MNIADLKSFLAIVELHSISLAAKKLHVSQPALSKRIKKLESLWNAQLFVSTGLRTELTEKGKQLLPYVRQMIHLNNEMVKHTGTDKKKPQLLINLGATVYIAKTIVPLFTMYLHSLGLEYFINTKLVADKDVLKNLQDGNYDLIISPESFDGSVKLKSIVLWEEKIVPVVGKKHPLASLKKGLSLAELAEHDAVLMEKSFGIRRVFDEEVERQGLSLNVLSEANIIYNNIALVEQGLAWSLVYERLLKPDLIPLPLFDYSPTLKFYCHLLKTRMDDRLIRVFIDHLINWVNTSHELSGFSANED